VLAVTALIAALAASAFRTHTVRTQIAESLALAAGAQNGVAKSFERDGEPPRDRESAGLSRAKADDRGPYLDSASSERRRLAANPVTILVRLCRLAVCPSAIRGRNMSNEWRRARVPRPARRAPVEVLT